MTFRSNLERADMTDTPAAAPNDPECLHCRLLESIDHYQASHPGRSRTAVIGELVQVIADLVVANPEHTVAEQTSMIVDTLTDKLMPREEISLPLSATQH